MATKTPLLILAAMLLINACQPQESAKLTPPTETNPPPVQQSEMKSEPQIASKPAISSQTSTTTQNSATTSRQLGNASSLTANRSSLAGTVTGFTSKKTEKGLEIDISSDVLFDFDKAYIKTEAIPALQKVAELIRTQGKGVITITGHTDSKGDAIYNQKLSLQRAQTIKDWLVQQGLNNEFIVEGKGETEPVALNENSDGSDNPDGRAQNRRVGILVKTSAN